MTRKFSGKSEAKGRMYFKLAEAHAYDLTAWIRAHLPSSSTYTASAPATRRDQVSWFAKTPRRTSSRVRWRESCDNRR